MSGNRRRDLAEKLAAMTVERGCTPAEAETAARLLAALSSDRELPFFQDAALVRAEARITGRAVRRQW